MEIFFTILQMMKKNVNIETFNECFKYQNPIYLLKDLYEADKAKNEKIVKHINDALIDLRDAVNRKQIPENENVCKVIGIIEEIFNNKKLQKQLKILTLKRMLQRLPIEIAQVKTVITYENLLNEIHQIIYYLYRAR